MLEHIRELEKQIEEQREEFERTRKQFDEYRKRHPEMVGIKNGKAYIASIDRKPITLPIQSPRSYYIRHVLSSKVALCRGKHKSYRVSL